MLKLAVKCYRTVLSRSGVFLIGMCLTTGGRAVLDGMEKQLGLHPARLLPSRETLRRYGNTSSSSIWYITLPIASLCSKITPSDYVLIGCIRPPGNASTLSESLHVRRSQQAMPTYRQNVQTMHGLALP